MKTVQKERGTASKSQERKSVGSTSKKETPKRPSAPSKENQRGAKK